MDNAPSKNKAPRKTAGRFSPELSTARLFKLGFDSKAVRLCDLPEILTPDLLMLYLPFGRDAIYALLKTQTIRNIRVGQKYIITKAALRDFLGGCVE